MKKLKTVDIETIVEKEVLKDIKEKLFDKNKIQFLVTGSFALKEIGFDVNPHDIDIEAICNEEQENILSVLSASCGNDYYDETYKDDAEGRMENVTWKHKPFIFQWNGISINVWVVDKFSHPYFLNEEGIRFAKPMSILEKKIAYRRNKDYRTLNDIVQQLLKIEN